MKEIPLTQGKVAQVDDEDYDFLMQWKWYASKSRQTYIARRSIAVIGSKNRIGVLMHKQIITTQDGMVIDHIDHNSLNKRSCY